MTEAEARALRQENAALLTRDGFVTDGLLSGRGLRVNRPVIVWTRPEVIARHGPERGLHVHVRCPWTVVQEGACWICGEHVLPVVSIEVEGLSVGICSDCLFEMNEQVDTIAS